MRYLIKYTKESEIKFVGHLDLMRTIQRIVRRTDLPVEYSKGFNPHILLSIAQPLSVGAYSEGEYLDLVFVEETPEEEIINKLNKVTAKGVKFLDASKVDLEPGKKAPQAMALIDAAKYTIKVKCIDEEKALKDIEELQKKDKWEILKKSKKKEKMVDLKEGIKELKFWVKDDYLIINTLAACGSKQNLSAQLLGQFLKNSSDAIDSEKFVSIKREEMYAYKGKKLVPLHKYFK